MDTASERLKAARIAAGFRRAKEFAETIGVAHQTYSSHERGPENGGRGLKRPVAEIYVEKLSEYLEALSIDWLLFGRGNPPLSLQGLDNLKPTGFAEDAVPFDIGVEEGEDKKNSLIEALYPGHPNSDLWTVGTEAMNLAGILPGDQIITDLSLKAKNGDVVLAQIHQEGVANTFTVLRQYEEPYLISRSTNQSLSKPLLVDGEQITILAVVVVKCGRL
ncbi:MAG: LexA family transcriptional regulator [Alphaproteobacteria bacterium]|nr:LexA family transcriptional regulator [Rhodospirillales bacterium]MCW9045667.1 LexA family transcriptional regulator [Alphaproteobacteria bacterium]